MARLRRNLEGHLDTIKSKSYMPQKLRTTELYKNKNKQDAVNIRQLKLPTFRETYQLGEE